jgi:hypothetical protein
MLGAMLGRDCSRVAGLDIAEVLALDMKFAEELTRMLHELPPLHMARGAPIVLQV